MSAELLSKDEVVEDRQDRERKLVRQQVQKVYRLIDDNLQSVGGIETAAGFCRYDRADLRRAIDSGVRPPENPAERRRYLAIEHVVAIMTRMRQYNAGKATEIAAALVYPAGFLVFPLVEMPAEEKARRYEQMLRSMPLGEQLIEQALKTP
jgi:hypothetical protein